jgi:hypothetical protein
MLCLPDSQDSDSKDNKYFLDTLYQDYFYKDVDRRVHAYGVKVGRAAASVLQRLCCSISSHGGASRSLLLALMMQW